jgi:hypothetical protein
MNRKTEWICCTILFIASFGMFILGIHWGLPSYRLNALYFSDDVAKEKTSFSIKQYPVEEAWKGWGGHLVLYEEEAQRKLSRNLYNSIRSYHPDEYAIIKVLSYMNPANFDFNPRAYSIGGAYIYLIGGVIFFLSKIGLLEVTRNLEYYFYHPEEMAKFYIVGRIVTVLYGVGIIILTYLILSRFTDKKWQSFTGASLLLLAPLMLLNSLYMYVDIPGVFWIMAGLYMTILFIERFSLKRIFLAGIFIGLALGTKITFAISSFIPILGLLLVFRNWKDFIKGSTIAFAGFFVAFFVTNPYFFITFPAPLIELGQHTRRVFSGGFYLISLFHGLGMFLFLFCLTGIVNASILMKRQNVFQRKTTVLLLSWTFFFFVFISLFAKAFARYILPAVPPLVILGSIGWFGIYEKMRLPLKKILSVGFILTVSWTFIYGMSYKMFFIKENIRTEAGIWIKDNIPAGSSIGVTEVPWQFQMPPFDYYRYNVVVTGYDFDKTEETKPDYFILSSYQAQLPPYPLRLQKERTDFWEKFRSSELYREKKKFQRFPRFLGFTFRTDVLPEDLIYLNPTIAIFERKLLEEGLPRQKSPRNDKE